MPGEAPRLICICGEEIELELVGGQYQSSWDGSCPNCGRLWQVNEVSEVLEELEEE